MTEKDWSDAKTAYVTSGVSYRQIAEKYGVTESLIRKRGAKEKWVAARDMFYTDIEQKILNKAAKEEVKRYDKIVRVSNKALERIDQMIEKCNDAQGMRALIASLRDIKGIQCARSDAESREQEARIRKLEKESADDRESVTEIVITGLPEGLDE